MIGIIDARFACGTWLARRCDARGGLVTANATFLGEFVGEFACDRVIHREGVYGLNLFGPYDNGINGDGDQARTATGGNHTVQQLLRIVESCPPSHFYQSDNPTARWEGNKFPGPEFSWDVGRLS